MLSPSDTSSAPTEPPEADQDAAHTPYIKEIVLQNFMCHKNFRLELGPSMNVIVGTNGSGKSSVLTGIMVALGGRARTTSRGDSLASLVQTGKMRATVSLKIHIPPEYRQMYQKYGSQVTVTRTINSKGAGGRGSSQYQLKDSQGRIVKGGNAQEVRSLCEHFGLYPDNELAMLSQENAKEFLVSATPQVKYDKLRKALLQNVIEHDRALVNSHNKEQEDLVGRIRILRNSATEKEAKANEILDRAQLHATASAQLRAIKLVLAWRRAKDASTRVSEAEQKLADHTETLNELREQLDVNTRTEHLAAQKEPLTEHSGQISDRITELIGEKENAAQDVNRAQTLLRSTEDEVRQLEESAAKHEREIADAERAVAELTPEAIARRREEIERQTREAASRRAEASAAVRSEGEAIADLHVELSNRKTLVSNAHAHSREIDSQLRALENELRDVERGNMAATHIPANVVRLQQLVERAQWNHKPLGPLYQFVRMKDAGADFAPALERIWTNTLEGWWVQTEEDRRKLLNLSDQCNIRNLRVFKRKDDPFDYSSALPGASSDYTRALDVIQSTSEAINRILVDLNHIENLVLVKSNDIAFKVTDSRIPSNKVRMALSMTTGRGGHRSYTSVATATGRTESATVQPMPQARMKVGAEARTRQLKADIREKMEELDIARKQVKIAEQSLKTIQVEIDGHETARKKAEALRRRAEDEQDALSASLIELETHAKSEDANSELVTIRNKLAELTSQIKIGHEALGEQQEDIEDKKGSLAALTEQLRTLKQQQRDLDSRLRRINKELSSIESTAHRARIRYERKKEVCDEIEAELRTLQIDLDESVRQAEEHGSNPYLPHEPEGTPALEPPQITSGVQDLLQEPTDSLNSKLNTLRGQQEAISAAEEEIRAAQQMKDQARKEFESIQRSETDIVRLMDEIKQRQHKRDENEVRAWDAIKQRICLTFKKTLRRRSFVGEVEINDARSRLTTHATPGESSERSTSTLSGGEKSFTQVALLMAVWSTMHVGFVAMDEYDVYMDKVNRSLSLRLLAQVVENKDLQCVLITPQDVDARALQGMAVKIHKLAAARP